MAAEILFWITAALIAYAFVGYPLLLGVLGRIFPFRPNRGNHELHALVIVPYYNEADRVADKIENCIKKVLHVKNRTLVFASDGSDDQSDEIVQSQKPKSAFFYRADKRVGKTELVNQVAARYTSDIIVINDLDTTLMPGAVESLLSWFADPRVGAVAGVRTVEQGQGPTYRQYLRLNTLLLDLESKIGRLVGASGNLYGFRRDLLVRLPGHTQDDLIYPLKAVLEGGVSIQDKNACVQTRNPQQTKTDFVRIRRIVARAFSSLAYLGGALFKDPLLCLCLFSHKILKWFLLPLLVVNLCAAAFSAFGQNPGLYRWAFAVWGAVLFGVIALTIVGKITGRKWMLVPANALVMTLAMTAGWAAFVFKKRYVTW